jgi:hypothetical protein
MVQLADLFSVPEMLLLCQVAEYFKSHSIDFHPEIMFHDVKVKIHTKAQKHILMDWIFSRLQCKVHIRSCTRSWLKMFPSTLSIIQISGDILTFWNHTRRNCSWSPTAPFILCKSIRKL